MPRGGPESLQKQKRKTREPGRDPCNAREAGDQERDAQSRSKGMEKPGEGLAERSTVQGGRNSWSSRRPERPEESSRPQSGVAGQGAWLARKKTWGVLKARRSCPRAEVHLPAPPQTSHLILSKSFSFPPLPICSLEITALSYLISGG